MCLSTICLSICLNVHITKLLSFSAAFTLPGCSMMLHDPTRTKSDAVFLMAGFSTNCETRHALCTWDVCLLQVIEKKSIHDVTESICFLLQRNAHSRVGYSFGKASSCDCMHTPHGHSLTAAAGVVLRATPLSSLQISAKPKRSVVDLSVPLPCQSRRFCHSTVLIHK